MIIKDVFIEANLHYGSEKPVINTDPLPKYAMGELDYGMTIGIAVTPKGRQFVCWVGGGDSPKAFFLLAYSDTDGKTWSEPCLVIDPHRQELICDRSTIIGTLWVDPLKRLWLFFNQSLGHFDGKSGNWYIRCDEPDTEKLVWSEPRYIGYGHMLNKPVVLSNGEWLLPSYLGSRNLLGGIHPEFSSFYHELDDMRGVNVFVSSDNGETWNYRGGLNLPDPSWDEPMIVELKDRRLWMLCRTSYHLMESFSSDLGKTWSRPLIARVQSASARFHLRRLVSGRILLVKHGEKAESAAPNHARSFLTAFLSDNDGESWRGGLVLDERNYISYPDADQNTNGMIYITYDRCREELGEILEAGLTEEDILRGKIVTPGAFLKRLILRPGKPQKWPTV
jgi:hypothetical protein